MNRKQASLSPQKLEKNLNVEKRNIYRTPDVSRTKTKGFEVPENTNFKA